MIPLAPLFIQMKESLEQLLEVLSRERSALATATADDILQLAAEKKSLLDTIESANQKRAKMLIKFGVVEAKAPDFVFKDWLAQQPATMDDVKQMADACNELLEQCKKENFTNARILSTLQKRNKVMFETLQGHSRKNKVYTASGNTRPVSSKHTLGRA